MLLMLISTGISGQDWNRCEKKENIEYRESEHVCGSLRMLYDSMCGSVGAGQECKTKQVIRGLNMFVFASIESKRGNTELGIKVRHKRESREDNVFQRPFCSAEKKVPRNSIKHDN